MTIAHEEIAELREQSRSRRLRMVDRQLVARGIRDPAVLQAFRRVPREAFLPESLRVFAYDDSPLPIGLDQTISQPFVVAHMVEALQLGPDARVLEVGAGSGYAAAILAELAAEVYTIERHEKLAEDARAALDAAGYGDVRVIHGDGSRGHEEAAPYDGIVVAAGGPRTPPALLEQLAVGGRLVIPVGRARGQDLVVTHRLSEDDYRRESLGAVRFVPLVGEQGWEQSDDHDIAPEKATPITSHGGDAPRGEAGGNVGAATTETRSPAAGNTVERTIAAAAEPFASLQDADLEPLIRRIGGARVVLLGEATHGTSEFYRLRARVTRELIEKQGFDIVAIEADWPDAARVDRWVRRLESPPAGWTAFARFPTWMWRNEEMRDFVDDLRQHNEAVPEAQRAGFYGLDLYSMYTSIGEVLEYLDGEDPEAAELARRRYACLSPWEGDAAAYGLAATTGAHRSCAKEVRRMLTDLLERRLDEIAGHEKRPGDEERLLDAVQNARLVADAEHYYRAMYYGTRESWNLRDRHMFETLQTLLAFRDRERERSGIGGRARAVVWEHNSHVGDAAATEMGSRGELNVGRLCREAFGNEAHIVGFGTHRGTVAAASSWDGPVQTMEIRPSRPDSYEHLCHRSGVSSFFLDLHSDAREALLPARLERAIGVIYRPQTERQSHYFRARLPRQFDDYVWFDETRSVTPLQTLEMEGVPATAPSDL